MDKLRDALVRLVDVRIEAAPDAGTNVVMKFHPESDAKLAYDEIVANLNPQAAPMPALSDQERARQDAGQDAAAKGLFDLAHSRRLDAAAHAAGLLDKLVRFGAIVMQTDADGPATIVVLAFPDTAQAKAAHDAIIAVKDASMDISETSERTLFLGDQEIGSVERNVAKADDWHEQGENQATAEHQAAFAAGTGAALHILQGGDEIDPIDAALLPLTLDPLVWREHFCAALGITPYGPVPTTEVISSALDRWFKAAIQAGYSAARPLDPGTIYIQPTEPGIVSGYDFARAKVDPGYAATGRITPGIDVERDAAGEGAGAEKPE
jgi:hypothetical protein